MIAEFLRRAFGVALQHELTRDPRVPFRGFRNQFIQAADRAYRFLQRKNYLSAHFFRGSSQKLYFDGDGGRVGVPVGWGATPGERESAFERFAGEIQRAKAGYQETRELEPRKTNR